MSPRLADSTETVSIEALRSENQALRVENQILKDEIARLKEAAARHLYEQVYCARGDMENRIKECQGDLFADRTSAATMRANQVRLWFASMAYVLICALRRIGLKHTQFAKATCGTIRLKLLKIGALVRRAGLPVRSASWPRLSRTRASSLSPKPVWQWKGGELQDHSPHRPIQSCHPAARISSCPIRSTRARLIKLRSIEPNRLHSDKPGRVEDGRGGLGLVATPRFPSPLIKPDVQISRIRLSDWLHLTAHGGAPR
jgi:hypothetical protein